MNTFQLRPILYFVLLSYGLAWIVALPLWLNGGLEHPYFEIIAAFAMGTPALAAAIVSKATDRGAKLSVSLGIEPWKPWRRTLVFCLVAALASLLIAIMALVIGSAFGVYRFDIENFSGFNELLKTQLAGREAYMAKLPPIKILALLQVLSVLVAAPFNAIFALGEEAGWRGWLLPKLMPLGTLPALVISGVIWALWHSPVILLGFNYPSAPGWLGLVCMTAMCIAFGSVLAWLRIHSGSVWPAAVGHGAFNAAGGIALVFGAAGQKIDPTQATALGWTGWIFPACLALLMFVFLKKKDGPTPQL